MKLVFIFIFANTVKRAVFRLAKRKKFEKFKKNYSV